MFGTDRRQAQLRVGTRDEFQVVRDLPAARLVAVAAIGIASGSLPRRRGRDIDVAIASCPHQSFWPSSAELSAFSSRANKASSQEVPFSRAYHAQLPTGRRPVARFFD